MSPRQTHLERLGYAMDWAPGPAALYRPVVVSGTTAYISGCLPSEPAGLASEGKLGLNLDVEAGRAAARLCAVNLLRNFRHHVGPLEMIQCVVRIAGYVNSAPDFCDQHRVLDGASELLRTILGESGEHSRSAVGVSQLPLGASVEVDAIIEVQP